MSFNPDDPNCPDTAWGVFLYLLRDIPMIILIMVAFLIAVMILNALDML